jgi:hypothetical protein
MYAIQQEETPVPDVVCDGGWWPPGSGEPTEGWTYEPCQLRVNLDDGEDQLDILQITPSGDRALCSVPVDAFASLFAQAFAAERSGTAAS